VDTTIEVALPGISKAFAVFGEKTVIIDTGSPRDPVRLVRNFSIAGIDPRTISLIVLTHAHRDHTGNLETLRKLTDAPVLAHRAAAEVLRTGRAEAVAGRSTLGRLLSTFVPTARKEKPVDVDIEIDSETDLAPYGVDGHILPTPGHTRGSLSVILPGGVAIVGDLIMAFGFRHRLADFAEDEEAMRNSLKLLLDRGVDRFLPSHGSPCTRSTVESLLAG